MNKKDRIDYLLRAYVSGAITTAEHEELFGIITSGGHDGMIGAAIYQDLLQPSGDNTADLPPHISQEIIRNIFAAEKNTAKVLPLRKPVRRLWRWTAAAAILLLVALTGYLLMPLNDDAGSLAALIPAGAVNRINDSDKPLTVQLSDGSTVVLQPHSKLHYTNGFAADKREVFLEGEAFFEVAKDPRKPFFVYYKHIVTRVLGTSFTVNTNRHSGNVEVSVRTGKVQVFENDQLVNGEKSKGVILTPNQKGVYKPGTRLFETALVELPQPLVEDSVTTEKQEKISFNYTQQKLSAVFKDIEKKYGIEIVLDNSNLNNCVFTGDVSEQDLYKKLKIICLTTNSSYEIAGTRILIRGEGCN